MKYQTIASGTFDLLHKGHKSFLKKSLQIGEEVIIGITSDSYITSFKNSQDIEDFETRRSAVEKFIDSLGAANKAIIIPIDSVYGPLLTNDYDPKIITVTPENEKNAIKINSERQKKGLKAIEIKVIEMDRAEDGGIISSTRIRNGEINRDGKLYILSSWKDHSFVLPEQIRSELQEPFGEVLLDVPLDLNPKKTITIGDVTTQKFNQENVGQFLSIVDFQVQRHKEFEKLSELGFEEEIKAIKVDNPAATITPRLIDEIRNAFTLNRRGVILVNGEEDLAVLPVILFSPLGFRIFYGQPKAGLVEVEITEERKEKAFELISKFELS